MLPALTPRLSCRSWLVLVVLGPLLAGLSAPARGQILPALESRAQKPPKWVSGSWEGTWLTPSFDQVLDSGDLKLTFTQVSSKGIKATLVYAKGRSHPGGTYHVTVKAHGDAFSMSGGGLTLSGSHSGDPPDDELSDDYTRPSEKGHFVLTRSTQATTEIDGEIVIRDRPRSPIRKLLSSSDEFLAYGGNGESTADELTLRCQALGSAKPKHYSWSVEGEGSENYPPPPGGDASDPNAKLWKIGGKFVPAKPADMEVTCTVDWSDGTRTDASQHVQIGIRTDDVLVIGWIDPTGVPRDPTGVGSDVLDIFPLNGKFRSLKQQAACAAYLLRLTVPTPLIRPDGNGLLQPNEAEYILNWQFTYGANKPLPRSFANDEEIAKFKAEGHFKLFNRAQIKYRTSGGNMTVDGVLHQELAIGITRDPITRGAKVPGVSGPDDGKQETKSDSWSLINEGSPAAAPVATFNNLAAPFKVIWNDIGSRIVFSPGEGANAQIDAQLYPTYNVYVSDDSGGVRLQSQHPEAPRPLDNFTVPAFPSTSSDLSLLFRRTFYSG